MRGARRVGARNPVDDPLPLLASVKKLFNKSMIIRVSATSWHRANVAQTESKNVRHHLLIAGTGRCGTSLLVRVLDACGLETGLRDQEAWDPTANAGLENIPLLEDNPPYVVKSPWSYQFLDELLAREDVTLDGVIIPIRNLAESTASRIIVELHHRYQQSPEARRLEETWRHVGLFPGGVTYSLEPLDQARILAQSLHLLLEKLADKNIPVTFLKYPKFASDLDYLFDRVRGFLSPAMTRSLFHQTVAPLTEKSKIRVESEVAVARTTRGTPPSFPSPELPAFEALDRISLKRTLNSDKDAYLKERDVLVRERDALLKERAALITKCERLIESVGGPELAVAQPNHLHRLPAIDVLLVTYNHAAYISKALEGVLAQEYSGKIRVIVADDASQDTTVEMIRQLAGRQNEVEFVFLDAAQNHGITRNYQRGFAACSAPFVAVLEGDDYWTSTQKLNKQVQFLKEHTECVAVSCNHYVHDAQRGNFALKINRTDGLIFLTPQSLIAENLIGNFSTCVYRREVLERLPPKLFSLTSYDWIVNICAATHGLVGFLSEPLSVYRIHDKGAWNSMTLRQKFEAQIAILPIYDELTGYAFTREFANLKRHLSRHEVFGHKRHGGEQTRALWRRLRRICPPQAVPFLKGALPQSTLVWLRSRAS